VHIEYILSNAPSNGVSLLPFFSIIFYGLVTSGGERIIVF